MKILVLNGSPRKNGNVSTTLKNVVVGLGGKNDVDFVDVSSLNFKSCVGCMICRNCSNCVLPSDDAHSIAEKIRDCDMLIVGSPVYWGNMNGNLKRLFDRLVYVLMGESDFGIPIPLNKGKKAIIVTSCTTPFPFNYLCKQTSGCVRAIKEVLKTGGFKIIKKINLYGTKKL